jgi:hypothetical protein
MPHTVALTFLASAQHGAGPLLRTVISLAIPGAALLAWFVLRGYGNQD